MGKFILKNGKEVKIGDTLIKHTSVGTSLGEGSVTQVIVVDKETLPELIKSGILIQVDPIKDANCTDKQCAEVPTNIDFYIEKIANRLGWHSKKVWNYLNGIHQILPAAVLSIILREIATELDKKYKNHIENSSEIYVISLFNGEIIRVDKTHIKNYKNFAAFRSIEDAQTAYRIATPIIEDMFKSKSEQ